MACIFGEMTFGIVPVAAFTPDSSIPIGGFLRLSRCRSAFPSWSCFGKSSIRGSSNGVASFHAVYHLHRRTESSSMTNALKTTFLLAMITALFLVVGEVLGGQRGMIFAFALAVV